MLKNRRTVILHYSKLVLSVNLGSRSALLCLCAAFSRNCSSWSFSPRRDIILSTGLVSVKLHYTDTGYGHVVQHHQRTSSQQFYNWLYNEFAISHCQSPTSRHIMMLGCGKFLFVGGEFVVQQVVELSWACPLVVLYNIGVVQHVRSRCPCSGGWHLVHEVTSYCPPGQKRGG